MGLGNEVKILCSLLFASALQYLVRTTRPRWRTGKDQCFYLSYLAALRTFF